MDREIMGRIVSVGSALPRQAVTNRDLAAEYGVTEEWITRRCGIECRYVSGDETATSLGAQATRKALAESEVRPDLLLCATFSPDALLTPIAPAIAVQAGLEGIAAFDLNAACAGGLTAFLSGLAFISSGLFQNVLVVATDTTTKHLAQADLSTRMLFSDGAAAILLGRPAGDSATLRVRSHRWGSDGNGAGFFCAEWCQPRGGLRPCVNMDGPALFRFAVETGKRTLTELCSDAEIAPESLSRILIHQANARISSAIRDEFSVPAERWPEAFQLGNLAGASLLFLMAEEFTNRRAVCGDLLALIAFGAGLTWAGSVLEVGC
jgi:3-oxoacyl-[acyl-carrier-protein] synthase-3